MDQRTTKGTFTVRFENRHGQTVDAALIDRVEGAINHLFVRRLEKVDRRRLLRRFSAVGQTWNDESDEKLRCDSQFSIGKKNNLQNVKVLDENVGALTSPSRARVPLTDSSLR